jgi:hypothetical protein
MGWMTIPLYGCQECGQLGWTRPGERVDGAGEEGSTPYVRKAPRPGAAGGDWIGDCGHAVPNESNLAQCLTDLPIHAVGPLVENRPVEMRDWPRSATG